MTENSEISTDVTASVAGAMAGILIGGPAGAVVGAIVAPVVADIGKRMLSPKEVTRVDCLQFLVAERVAENVSNDVALRSDLSSSQDIQRQMSELFEGFLLKARGMYEEKKLPLLANLCARSFFTNTPLENILRSLSITDRLSYRQLVILSLFNPFRIDPTTNTSDLTKYPLRSLQNQIGDEYSLGVVLDLWDLVQQGLLTQTASDHVTLEAVLVPGDIIPGRLELSYLGRLLHNLLMLSTVEELDKESVVSVLSKTL